MAGKKRCFSTIRALRRLHPGLLCRVLEKSPEYLVARGVALPEDPTLENMPYDAIKDACMVGDVPGELDDVLYYVSELGNKEGWDKIEREAAAGKLRMDFPRGNFSCADLAMLAWLHDWPRNRELLGQSHARVTIHRRSSYAHYPPTMDVRKMYRTPSNDGIGAFRQVMEDYFIREELGKGTSVVVYDYDMEIWFLIRYPGAIERFEAISDEGKEENHSYKPAEYDAVVYHKIYGDLRLNTNRPKDHAHYRMAFADLLFGMSNVFHPTEKVVRLDPLLGPCRGIFRCEDIRGLAAIAPIEVCFSDLALPGRLVTWRAEEGLSLLD